MLYRTIWNSHCQERTFLITPHAIKHLCSPWSQFSRQSMNETKLKMQGRQHWLSTDAKWKNGLCHPSPGALKTERCEDVDACAFFPPPLQQDQELAVSLRCQDFADLSGLCTLNFRCNDAHRKELWSVSLNGQKEMFSN